jgi:hypothetical protein
MRPLAGSAVRASTPPAARAFELTHAECPSALLRNAGRPPVASSSTSLRANPPGTPAAPNPRRPPTRRRELGGAGPHPLNDRFRRGQVVQVALGQLDAAADGMDVRVVEAREHHPPLEGDHPCPRTGPGLRILGGPDEGDAAVAHGHRLTPRAGRHPSCRRRPRRGEGRRVDPAPPRLRRPADDGESPGRPG